MPFDGAQRAEWKVESRVQFFESIFPLFKTLEREDKSEIKLRLEENDPEYFEIPIYDKAGDEDPAVIVIFDGSTVFSDFVEPKKKIKYLDKMQGLLGATAKPINWRDLTTSDWEKRLDVMNSLSPF